MDFFYKKTYSLNNKSFIKSFNEHNIENYNEEQLILYLKDNYHKLFGYPEYYEDYIGDEWIHDEEINSIIENGFYEDEVLKRKLYPKDLQVMINEYIDYVEKNNDFIDRYDEFATKYDYIEFAKSYITAINKYLELLELKTVNNKNSVSSNTQKNKNKENLTMENNETKNSTKWVVIPEECISKPFKAKYQNGQEHSCVLVKLPNNQMFRILESQVKPHFTIKELRSIPIGDYGINLVESKGKDEIKELKEQGNNYKHLNGDEAYEFLTKDVFSQLNNENTRFLKIPSNLVTDMPLDKSEEKKSFVSVKLPSYMQERDGFKFANATFYTNKAYHVIDDKNDLRAIPCYDKVLSGENAGKAVFFKISNYDKEIEIKSIDLFNYNKEDYAKYINGMKKTENSNGIKEKNDIKEAKTEEKTNTSTHTKTAENDMK